MHWSSYILILTTCSYLTAVKGESKLYYGQRIYTDVHMVDLIDPGKHGFHIILDQQFVQSYLQPVHLPTVYASAIPVKTWTNLNMGKDKNKTIAVSQQAARVTKILYPEKGDPENGLLDGRTIKLLGLQERSWYHVCVEFESNVNRHELATGTWCQLRRTLDKFGKSVETIISEIQLTAITHRSIAVQIVIDVDFPVLLHVYLTGSGEETASADVPVQMFVVKKSQTLNIDFGPFLQEDTVYGKLCILEEPLPSDNAYTAMGRSVKTTLEHCYFDDLKTKPAEKQQQRFRENAQSAHAQIRQVGERAARPIGNASNVNSNSLIIPVLVSCFLLFYSML